MTKNRRTDSDPEDIGSLDLALLGEYYDRKNRGRGFTLTSLDQAAPVVDSVGVDSLASQITITCGVEPSTPTPVTGAPLPEPGPAPPNTVDTPPVKGLLFWGNDGVETVAEFDYIAGTVLAVSAASVRVLARLDDGVDPADPMFVAPRVVAHIGYFPRGGQNAQRTRSVTLDEAGEANDRALIAIPPYARSVEVIQTASLAPAGAAYAIRFRPSDVTKPTLAGETTAAPYIDRPIPQAARLVDLANIGDSSTTFQLIFRLWL